jgi:hypothetical protein
MWEVVAGGSGKEDAKDNTLFAQDLVIFTNDRTDCSTVAYEM